MRMLWSSILSAVLLVSLAQASPLKNGSVENGSDGVKSSDSKKNGYPLPGNVTPGSYTIKLEPHLDDKNFTFTGESIIKFTFYSWGGTMKAIVLHAVDLEIEKEFTSLVSMDGRTTLRPTTQSLDKVKEFFTIEFTPPIKTDYYTLNLRYTGKLKEDPKGFYRVRRQIDGHDVWEALTQFKPSYARRAFPCFDEIGMAATFSISIKRPKNYEVRSTTLQVMSKDDGDKSWTQFRSAYRSPDQIDFKVVCDLNCSRWYGSTTDEPPFTTNEPPSTTDEPPSTTDEPPFTTNEPPSTTDEPPSTTDEPPSTTDEPPSTTDAPPFTTDAPPFTTDEPPSTTDEPPSTTDEPPSTTDAPPFTTDAPPFTTDEPPSTTDEPPSTTDEPPSTTDIGLSTPEMAASTTNPPTNQKCIHATYLFTCTQCRPLINISLS